MATIDFSILNQGLDQPSAYAQKQNALMAQQLQQEQLSAAQGQNALGQMNLRAAQQGVENKNALVAKLRGLPAADQDAAYEQHLRETGDFAGLSAHIKAKAERTASEAKTNESNAKTRGAEATTAASQFKLQKDKVDHGWESITKNRTPEAYATAVEDAVTKGYIDRTAADNELSLIPFDPADFSKFRNERLVSLLSAKDQLEINKPTVVGKNLVDPTTGKVIFTAPGLLPADEEAQRIRIAEKGRAPRAEPAPSVTSIVDPTNSARMISVDTRQYRGGGVGSPGVIGVSGKEPKAAATEEANTKGRENANALIASLRNEYDNLYNLGAITSTKNRAGTNVGAGIGSSDIGQFTGRLLGTDAQSARNTIKQTRPLLLQAIMKATGMSAKQIDSNAELKIYLSSATDPSLDYEANMKALSNLETLIGGGKTKSGAAVAPPAGFTVDKK